MRANRRRDSEPELSVRRELHRRGLRYQVDWPLPFDRRRRADIAFPRCKVAVFVDGCFWHRCPAHYRAPRSNAEYWDLKTQCNAERDVDTTESLEALGWTVLRFWEHTPPEVAADHVHAVVLRALQSRQRRTHDPHP